MNRLVGTAALFLIIATSVDAQTIDLTRYRMIDLTHALNAKTLYWPTSPTSFKLDQLSFGPTPGGWFYAANAFSAPEHGGTHLDAPIVGSSRVDLQACKLEYSIVSPK